jgi:hypothetical protein
MAITSETRTIHTVFIDLPDDIVGKWEFGDQVEIVVASRNGSARSKKLTWGDVNALTEENPSNRPYHNKKVRVV